MYAFPGWKIQMVVDATGCSENVAIAYLYCEEGIATYAIESYRADNPTQ